MKTIRLDGRPIGIVEPGQIDWPGGQQREIGNILKGRQDPKGNGFGPAPGREMRMNNTDAARHP
jgi:hypothetical protein